MGWFVQRRCICICVQVVSQKRVHQDMNHAPLELVQVSYGKLPPSFTGPYTGIFRRTSSFVARSNRVAFMSSSWELENTHVVSTLSDTSGIFTATSSSIPWVGVSSGDESGNTRRPFTQILRCRWSATEFEVARLAFADSKPMNFVVQAQESRHRTGAKIYYMMHTRYIKTLRAHPYFVFQADKSTFDRNP